MTLSLLNRRPSLIWSITIKVFGLLAKRKLKTVCNSNGVFYKHKLNLTEEDDALITSCCQRNLFFQRVPTRSLSSLVG